MPACADCGTEAGTLAFCPKCGGTRLLADDVARLARPRARRPVQAAGVLLILVAVLLGSGAAFSTAMPAWTAERSAQIFAAIPGGTVTVVVPGAANATVEALAPNGTAAASAPLVNGTATLDLPAAYAEIVVRSGNGTGRREVIVPDGESANVEVAVAGGQGMYVHPATVSAQRWSGIVGLVLAAVLLWGGIGACVQRQRHAVYAAAGIGLLIGVASGLTFTLPGLVFLALTGAAFAVVLRHRRMLR